MRYTNRRPLPFTLVPQFLPFFNWLIEVNKSLTGNLMQVMGTSSPALAAASASSFPQISTWLHHNLNQVTGWWQIAQGLCESQQKAFWTFTVTVCIVTSVLSLDFQLMPFLFKLDILHWKYLSAMWTHATSGYLCAKRSCKKNNICFLL